MGYDKELLADVYIRADTESGFLKCEIFMQRRLAIKQEEIDDDFSYARELREREKRLKALEEELEKKAR